VAVSACAANDNHLQDFYLERFANPNPTLTDFSVCHGFYCAERSPATISDDQWRLIAAVFKPRAKNARQERHQIVRAVAMIETIVGPQTGTDAHQWTHRNMYVIPNGGDLTQLDCIDTSVNSWTYMTLMERNGLFAFHRAAVLRPAAQYRRAGGDQRRIFRNRREPGGRRDTAADHTARGLVGLLAPRFCRD
jgi:hypothetical protein